MSWLKKQLRQRVLEQRRQLSPTLQQYFAQRISQRLFNTPSFNQATQIAFYLAFQGEVSTLSILHRAQTLAKSCYLPVLSGTSLKFAKYHPNDLLIKNRYGILEPTPPLQFIAPQELDLVLLPLVAFDTKGNRLGMGAGFYDITFAFRKRRSKPKLLGLAYDFQRVTKVPHNNHDIKVNGVITPTRFFQF